MFAERILMALLLGVIAAGCGVVLYPFFTAILWAGILAFSTWPFYQWVQRRFRQRGLPAALVMVVLCAMCLLLPFALVAPEAASVMGSVRDQVTNWAQNGLPAAPEWLQNVPFFGSELVDRWNIWAADLTGLTDAIRPYATTIAESGLRLAISVGSGMVRILLALFIAFFFWLSGDVISAHLRQGLQRVAGPRADHMIDVAGRAVRGTVYGIIGTAIAQGVLTGIGLSVAGVPRPLILAVIAGLLSVLPIGAPLVWIPAVLWLFATHHTGYAIFLLIWGIFAISGSDNLIRPYFIARGARIPFLLTVLGVLGGVVAFGLVGLFLGPTLLAIGYSLVTEFVKIETPANDNPGTPV